MRPKIKSRRAYPRVWAAGICLTSLLVLSSCGEERPDTEMLSLDAQADTSLITGSVRGLERRGVFIQLPAGLPDELASQLLARFQEASIANQLTLARTGTVPEYTVKGVVRAGTSRTGTAVVVVWEVIDADGKRVKRITDDMVIQRDGSAIPALYDPWAAVDEATLEQMADAAALELAGWVSDQTLGASPDADTTITTASIDAPEVQSITDTGALPTIDLSTPSLLQSSTEPSSDTELSGIAARNASLGISAPPAAPPPPSAPLPQPALIEEPTSPSPERTIAPTAKLDLPDSPSLQTDRTADVKEEGNRVLFDVAVGTSPGDGRLSLAAAVQDALVNAAFKTDKPQAYRVMGSVALEARSGTGAPGSINVSIEWTVTTKEGTPLGLVSQSNLVDEDVLAGAWGDIAIAAGTAAADGILQLIDAPLPPA